jgi:hypothetical protein
MRTYRFVGIVALFLIWLYAGMNRVAWAEWISKSLLPMGWLDTGLVSLFFLGLAYGIVRLSYPRKPLYAYATLSVQVGMLALILGLLLLHKWLASAMLFRFSESLIHLFFSPLPVLGLLLFFYMIEGRVRFF